MTVIDDVATLLGRDLTGAETVRATRLVEIAVAAVEASVKGIAITAGSEHATVYAGDNDCVWTPRYPVTALRSVTVSGNAVTTLTWTERGRVDFTVRLVNDFEVFTPPFGNAWPVVLDYDFGFTDLPADISAAIAAPVADLVRQHGANPDGVAAETLGPYQVSYVQAAVTGVAVPMIERSWKRDAQMSVPLVPSGVFPGGQAVT